MVTCCTAKRARTVGTILGLFDTVFLSIVFFKSVHILKEYGFNLLATSAVSCVGVLYGLHLFGIAASWVGFAREKSAFIVPKLVLKATTILGCYLITLVLVYFRLSDSYFLGDIIAKGFNSEYHHSKEVVDANALTAAGIAAALSVYQTCLFILLWYCYANIRDQEVADLLQRFLKDEKRKERSQMTTFM